MQPAHAVRNADEPAAVAIATRQAFQLWRKCDIRDGRAIVVQCIGGPCHLPLPLVAGRRLHGRGGCFWSSSYCQQAKPYREAGRATRPGARAAAEVPAEAEASREVAAVVLLQSLLVK
jgi:hypothetical protein